MTTVKAQVCDCDGETKNCERRAYIAGGLGVPAILGILGAILALLSEYCGQNPLAPGKSKEPHAPAKRVTLAKARTSDSDLLLKRLLRVLRCA